MIELALIFITTAFDAIRDGQSQRKPGIGWWTWHVPKWLAFYPVQIYLCWKIYADIKIVGLLFLTMLNWMLWNFIYEKVRKFTNEI